MMKPLLFSLALMPILHAEEADTIMQNQIEHVVVLMLENRSFDNVLAWLYDENDPPKAFIPEGTEPIYKGLTEATLPFYTNVLKDSHGNEVYRSGPIKGVPSVSDWPYLNSPQYNPYETFPNILKQIYGDVKNNEPTMTGFLQNYASCWWEHSWEREKKTILGVLETYTEKELPTFYSLAKHYAVSDEWFCSVPTHTNPNRAFAACGTSEGQLLDGPFTKSMFYSDTIWNKFTDLSPDTTWKIFWQTNMVTGIISGPLTGPNTFDAMNRIPNLSSHYESIAHFHELARNGTLPNFSFIEPQITSTSELVAGLPLPELSGFRVMLGLEGNDMHPPGDVRPTENLLANIYTSLIANSDAWNKTLLIITFDEHGGLFDHVAPPRAIAPDSHFENGFTFDRYGVRVPTIFISPLIDKSTIVRSNTPGVPFDHTSLLSTLLTWKKIDKSQWNMGKRTDVAPKFDSVLTRTVPRTDAILGPKKVQSSPNALKMGDTFYLRTSDGRYLVHNDLFFTEGAFAGPQEEKTLLTFSGGQGIVSHGSFAFIQGQDEALGENNYLQSSLFEADCYYGARSFSSGQWWTVKSVDRPYLGAPIQYGDRIFLENHIFLDIFQIIPARLAVSDSCLCKNLLTCKSLADESTLDNYWIIEKPADKNSFRRKL